MVVSAAPRLTATKFLAFGDSLTQGVDSAPVPATLWQWPDWPYAYPYKLGDMLTARYTDQTFTVLNAGLWGETVSEGLARLPSEVGRYQPDVLLLLEGANDLNNPSANAATTKYIAGRLQEMIHVARQAKQGSGLIVMLATFPPQYPGLNGAGAPWVPTMNGEILKVATAEGAILVDLYKDFMATGTRLIGVDGLHPTDAGFTQMAKSFYTAIQTNLEVKATTVQVISR